MNEPKQLKNSDDFNWYKQGLDVNSKYKHKHNGEPERYPCVVVSNFWDDPNGPYTYDHVFVYQQQVKCEHCGHETLIWPEQADA